MNLAPIHLNDRFGQVHIHTSPNQLLEVSPVRLRRYISCFLHLKKIRANVFLTRILFRLDIAHIAISKNVVRENDECQLSNGDCTTEKKCGY